MSRVSEEPRSWPDEAAGERLADDLRRQIDATKARFSEHREQMEAVGLAKPEDRKPARPAT
jgi:hypothetical protein